MLSVVTEAEEVRCLTKVRHLTLGEIQAEGKANIVAQYWNLCLGIKPIAYIQWHFCLVELHSPSVFEKWTRFIFLFLSCSYRQTCLCCSVNSSTAQGWPNRTLPSTSPSMNSCFWMPAPPHLLTPQSYFSMWTKTGRGELQTGEREDCGLTMAFSLYLWYEDMLHVMSKLLTYTSCRIALR